MTDWRRSQLVAAVAIVVFVVVQLAIPLSRLGPPHDPQRFAWQMFSNRTPSVQFTVETPTGTEEVDVNDFMAHPRAEIDLTALLPDHLCAVVPGAVRVTWETGSLAC